MTAEVFCRILRDECGVLPGAHILAAVSGGADSVAMLCLLDGAREIMGIRVSAAHVEHGIRGEDSCGDMEFVRDLCRQKKIALYVRRVDAPGYAREKGCGLEAAARELRYAFLKETKEAIKADVIAVAHHGGDQAETVLMHAARGSDLRGLCAMRSRRGDLIRPLLGVSAGELRSDLQAIGQPWREDATNDDLSCARNRIRRRVLPELEMAYPGAQAALLQLARSAQRDEDFFSGQIAALGLEMMRLADGVAIERAALEPLHEALLSRVLVRMMDAAGAPASARAEKWIVGALKNGIEETAADVGGGFEARLGKRWLCLTRPKAPIAEFGLAFGETTKTPFGVFEVREALRGETGDGITCQAIPARLLEGAVVCAKREGDGMIPFGQHTKVKLKKLLIDSGVERAMRRSVPVLRSRDGILWLAGIRPGELCRGAEEEKRMMVVFRGAQCVKIQQKDEFQEEFYS